MIARREFIGASALAAANWLAACAVDAVPKGRTPVRLWFSYGGTNREVLEGLVRRFNAAQSRDFVQAVYQGDYFEGLAKLRTAIAAGCAPATGFFFWRTLALGRLTPTWRQAFCPG